MKNKIEYIGIEEALTVTGLAEKTLKERLRGRVTMYGHASWDRQEFFDFFKEAWREKRSRLEDRTRTKAIQAANGY